MVQDVTLLAYLLPGFLAYALICRLLNVNYPKDTFMNVSFSLFLSLLIYAPLTYLESKKIISLQVLDWKVISYMILITLIISVIVILAIKKFLPSIEKKVQIFDTIKYNQLDVLTDILEKIKDRDFEEVKKKGIWLAICTTEGDIYKGYIKNQGDFTRLHKGLYLKKVIKIKGKKERAYDINEFEGILFLDNQIKWIGILNNMIESNRTKSKIKNLR